MAFPRRSTFMAGAAYFAIVFAVGFALGVVRVVMAGPAIGERAALALEIPFLLLVSWLASVRLCRRFLVPGTLSSRFAMGATALTLLALGEFGVWTIAFGEPASAFPRRYMETEAIAGLFGQLAFAAFPAVQLLIASESDD